MLNKLLGRLTDNYNKNPDSNIGKWYQIIARELGELERTFEDIKEYQDMDNAVDKTLDHIGKNVLEYRNTADDDLYRLLIKTKIIANLSKGDIETINEVASVLLGDGFIGLSETWNDSSYNNEPAGLVLNMRNGSNTLPFGAIDRIIAGGVGIKWVLEFKQDDSDVYIASVMLSGEETTIYPYRVTELEARTKINIALGYNTSVEEGMIYPRKEVF